MGKRNLSTRLQKIVWLAERHDFLELPHEEIQKRLITAGLISPKTVRVDLHIERLIEETKAWMVANKDLTPVQLTEIANSIGIVGAPVNMDVRKGYDEAARRLYSLCCSAPVRPVYRLNGTQLDGFDCAVCLNRCEKVGCVPSFYETSQGKTAR